MKRIYLDLKLSKKRDPNLITPCCGKKNRGSSGSLKFVNYEELPKQFGYCHSCGKATLPPPVYENDNGQRFIFNEVSNKYEPLLETINIVTQKKRLTAQSKKPDQKYIDENIAIRSTTFAPENNLLKYLRTTYGNEKTEAVRDRYLLGTFNDGATMFWEINKNLQVQKCKLAYYTLNGRRTNKFNQIYTNKKGYYSCLFGEHLVIDKLKGNQKLILVESEKTAVVGDILLPKFTWLSYGGKNGLTENKYLRLRGHKVLIVPDIENETIELANKKALAMREKGIDTNVWDMTNGRSDQELLRDGVHGKDLEDFFREIIL